LGEDILREEEEEEEEEEEVDCEDGGWILSLVWIGDTEG
jgi:hypothetical protein